MQTAFNTVVTEQDQAVILSFAESLYKVSPEVFGAAKTLHHETLEQDILRMVAVFAIDAKSPRRSIFKAYVRALAKARKQIGHLAIADADLIEQQFQAAHARFMNAPSYDAVSVFAEVSEGLTKATLPVARVKYLPGRRICIAQNTGETLELLKQHLLYGEGKQQILEKYFRQRTKYRNHFLFSEMWDWVYLREIPLYKKLEAQLLEAQAEKALYRKIARAAKAQKGLKIPRGQPLNVINGDKALPAQFAAATSNTASSAEPDELSYIKNILTDLNLVALFALRARAAGSELADDALLNFASKLADIRDYHAKTPSPANVQDMIQTGFQQALHWPHTPENWKAFEIAREQIEVARVKRSSPQAYECLVRTRDADSSRAVRLFAHHIREHYFQPAFLGKGYGFEGVSQHVRYFVFSRLGLDNSVFVGESIAPNLEYKPANYPA